MPRTLADMTPQEREACKGMWCEFEMGYIAILKALTFDRAYCICPREYNPEQSFRLDRLTPRFDLPRAWGADGEPVKGKWQEGSETECGIHIGSYFGCEGTSHRRFVHDWEAKP